MMENNDKMVLSEQTVGKEYQIPELVDLNGIGGANGGGESGCSSGSVAISPCNSGSVIV